MTDRPLLFSAPMVKALLAGQKTQTRRLLRNPEHWGCPTGDCPHNLQTECNEAMAALAEKDAGYQVGDRIWAKETWRTWKDCDRIAPRDLKEYGAPIFYEVDRDNCDRHGKTRVSIHMPRWASRLTLNVTEVRVEPLQNINRGDAMAEGCPFPNMAAGPDPRDWYRDLWNDLNGKDAWDANPWVVAVSFTVEQRNIDQ